MGEAAGVLVMDDYAHHPSEVAQHHRRAACAASWTPHHRRPPAAHLQPHRLPLGRMANLLGGARRAGGARNLRRARSPLPGRSAGDLAEAIPTGRRDRLRQDFDDAANEGYRAGPAGRCGLHHRRGRCDGSWAESAGAAGMSAIDMLATTLSQYGELRRDEPLSRAHHVRDRWPGRTSS
ncbi:MAG: hypothetical protein IPI33_11580 [Dehalococcoidia bacterium]|nr:hypothetical protein [Dehalococcoidia bacterium]